MSNVANLKPLGEKAGMLPWLPGGPWLVILIMKPPTLRTGDAAVEWFPGCWGDGPVHAATRARLPHPALRFSSPNADSRSSSRPRNPDISNAPKQGSGLPPPPGGAPQEGLGRFSSHTRTSHLCPAAGTSAHNRSTSHHETQLPPEERVTPATAEPHVGAPPRPAHKSSACALWSGRLFLKWKRLEDRRWPRPRLDRPTAPPALRLTQSPSAVEGMFLLSSWVMGLGLMSVN